MVKRQKVVNAQRLRGTRISSAPNIKSFPFRLKLYYLDCFYHTPKLRLDAVVISFARFELAQMRLIWRVSYFNAQNPCTKCNKHAHIYSSFCYHFTFVVHGAALCSKKALKWKEERWHNEKFTLHCHLSKLVSVAVHEHAGLHRFHIVECRGRHLFIVKNKKSL